uniref:hypothetical protein n=1 Tax=Collinsella intestinalis TaxID=147207 RepID=UPI004026B047
GPSRAIRTRAVSTAISAPALSAFKSPRLKWGQVQIETFWAEASNSMPNAKQPEALPPADLLQFVPVPK